MKYREDKICFLAYLSGPLTLFSKVFVVVGWQLFVVYDNKARDKLLVTDTQFVLVHKTMRLPLKLIEISENIYNDFENSFI